MPCSSGYGALKFPRRRRLTIYWMDTLRIYNGQIFKLFFEIWHTSGRSKKIRNEFEIYVEKAASVIENY
jgi:hypothetical protein